jgi:hypothetical protein
MWAADDGSPRGGVISYASEEAEGQHEEHREGGRNRHRDLDF